MKNVHSKSIGKLSSTAIVFNSINFTCLNDGSPESEPVIKQQATLGPPLKRRNSLDGLNHRYANSEEN